MDHQPFSVIISVYKNDNSVFFDRALESITDEQTIKPNEIVLIIDGPVTNEINYVVEKYSSRYNLKVIRLKNNIGLGNALRIAVENCSYELISRMDSDDVSVSNRFEQQLAFFEKNPNIDVCGGNISEFINEETNIIGYRTVPLLDEDIKRFGKKRCPFNHVTVMYKKTAVLAAGNYLDLHFNEDYYLWIRMWLNKCIFSNIGTTLVNVRTGLNQYERRGGKKYYESEVKIQRLMFESKIIGRSTFFFNCTKRFIIQRLLPNKIRGFVFRHFARKKRIIK